MECVFCWHYNSAYPQDVILKNSKYCKLYSQQEKKSKKPIENSENCKTLYTKCDYYLERWVHENIIELEKLFKDHEKLVKHEMELQQGVINDMWIQSQRYLILTSGVCVKTYPEIVSLPTEKRVLYGFHMNLRKINVSNSHLALSLEAIRSSQAQLNYRCEQLDVTIESPFMKGSYALKSLTYIRNILNDLFQYFYTNVCKLKSWALLLDPADSVAIEDYINLLKSNNECDLMENLKNCSCLRTKRRECIKCHKRC
ncbi:uncharacterized protein LOC119603076 [Lucilia sericata]|uniref:uncharacterized protein LOC119603076 n=1 Tax=Lucilia sericata TaxID=13632 RepID=UPI0018A80ACD|nr:uncharacterized protein LOC119603076 [Lucilia sericata]